MKNNILKIEKIIQKICEKDILLHSKRTKEIALILREIYGGNENVISFAALLHDIAIKDGFANHAKNGSRIVKEMFKNEWNTKLLEKVCYCILHHSIATQKPEKITPDLICVYDADKIDFLLNTNYQNPLYKIVLEGFLGKKSLIIYKNLRRFVKWYKK